MKKEINQIRIGTILSYVNLAIGNLIPLLYTPIMLKLLGQSEYGLYTLSQSVVGYLSLLSFGIGGTIVRYLSQARAEQDMEKESRILGLFIKIYGFLALLVIAVGILLSSQTNHIFSQTLTTYELKKIRILVLLMSVNTAITFPTSVFSSLVIAHERFLFSKLISILSTVAGPYLNLAMLFLGHGSVGMTVSSTAITFLVFCCNLAYCTCKLNLKPSFKNTDSNILKEIIHFSAFIFLGEVVNILYWATDKVLLGAMAGTEAVAVYTVGATFNSVMQSLGTTVGGMFSPRIVLNAVQGNDGYLNELFVKIGRIQFFIISLILTGFAVFGRQFIYLWVGVGYLQAYPVALLVMIPVSVPLIQSIGLQIIVAKNQHQFRAISLFFVAILNVVGTVLLIPIAGIIGAALATCIAYMIGPVLLMNWYYHVKTGIDVKIFWKNILNICPVSVILLGVGLFITRKIALLSWHSLFVGIIVYAVIYCALNWCFAMNNYEKGIFLAPIERIFNKSKHTP